MKVKVTFILETDKWEKFDDLKSDKPKVKSRKKWEELCAIQVGKNMKSYLDDETERILEIKAKIIERKDNK